MEIDKKKALAKNNAYRLLATRPRSEYEIKRRLKEKRYDAATIAAVVEDLRRTGDIDDAKFAKFWVESRMHLNPVGDVVIKSELKEKGVADTIIADALAAKVETYNEYEVAKAMAVERFERFKRLDRRKASKRLYDFLLRRGFAYDTVRRIIGDMAEWAAPEDDKRSYES